MHFPYQHLAVVQHGNAVESLIAVTGIDLLVISREGALVSQWKSVEVPTAEETDDRSPKRQKVNNPASKIINVTTAPDYDTFLVVTEDKNIHVLRLDPDGSVSELNRRCMPKRPCAVRLLAQEQLILCADKHGDVYSLPLIPDPDEDAKYSNRHSEDKSEKKTSFTPTATTLTVHTKRNRMALASQQQQKVFTQKKAPLAFEHKLLLGHVSMLTDLIFVRSEKHRNRIITADRDEHIRISRPPPQAYVIEGFCLGHTEFISVLCSIVGTTTIVSGGGDDWLGIWDWTTYELLYKIDLKTALLAKDIDLGHTSKIAVSTIRHFSQRNLLLVLCEKVKAIAMVDLTNQQVSIHATEAIPLDVVSLGSSVIIAFDVRDASNARLALFDVEQDRTLVRSKLPTLYALEKHQGQEASADEIDRTLYSITNLRKHGTTIGEDNVDEDD